MQNSRYDAFGELEGQSGSTENSYLFAGEQLDKDLGEYYLRQRYYGAETGRLTSRDKWEGRAREPISLNKYIYANSNPAKWIDPSGFSAIDPAVRGGAVNNAIGRYFIGWDPLNREYDHYGAGGQRISLQYIIRRSISELSDPGVPGLNQRYPDLVDFDKFQLWEIKPTRRFNQGLDELGEYLNILNGVQEMPKFWTSGDTFVPPPVIVTDLGDIAFVNPSILGVVTYDLLDQKNISSFLTGISIYLLMFYIAQQVANELVGATATASLTKGLI